jgi:ankyrin repeat protein
MVRVSSRAGLLFALSALTVAAQEPSDRYYQAIRNNDLPLLRGLLKTADVSTKDQRGTTPLMYAAAYGSLDAMKALLSAGADVKAKNAFDATALLWSANDLAKVRLLVAKGADVNARSKQGRTPLIVAASYDGGSEVVKFLLEKGADISARDGAGSTALVAATEANDTATVRLLLQKGADVNAAGVFYEGATSGQTPLMNAAAHGNVDVIKMLLAKGASVNVTGSAEGLRVKNGAIALGMYTPLLLAASFASPAAVKLLLDAGAKPNVQDVRGMTPLMLAVSSDRADPGVIRLLLDHGADPGLQSKLGESSLDWARKFGNLDIMKLLRIDSTQAAAAVLQPSAGHKSGDAREAAEKSLALLQHTGGTFLREGGCVACHAQNLTGIAVSVARANGARVDEATAGEQLKTVKLQFASADQILLQRMDTPGGVDLVMYPVLQLAAEHAAPDRAIDAMIHNIAGQQRSAGNWHVPGIARPPMEDGDFSRTAIALRCLSLYPLPGRKAEFGQRIAHAAVWLKSASPRTTEDRAMQLLGLRWAKAGSPSLEEPLKNLVALQHSDGGWSQTPNLASDAYATGQVLYTMHELGRPASDPAYRSGVAFLLSTQREDGSWFVRSRAPKFQPYFQSGFRYDHDQWISSAATAWAVMGLSYAVPEKSLAAGIRSTAWNR